MFHNTKLLPKKVITACLSTGKLAAVTPTPRDCEGKGLTLTCGLSLKKQLKNRQYFHPAGMKQVVCSLGAQHDQRCAVPAMRRLKGTFIHAEILFYTFSSSLHSVPFLHQIGDRLQRPQDLFPRLRTVWMEGVVFNIGILCTWAVQTIDNNCCVQSRFTDLMREKADLKERLEELEHRCIQLSGETDTIGMFRQHQYKLKCAQCIIWGTEGPQQLLELEPSNYQAVHVSYCCLTRLDLWSQGWICWVLMPHILYSW